MTEETTTEQLAEIEGQAESTPAEGWRVLAVGEVLRDGDMWVWPTDDQLRQTVHVGAVVGANQRYIRRIEPEAQPQPEPQAETDAELRIRLLKGANDAQAETIGQLKEEARILNIEIGGLERQLLQRDARIRDLETLHAAAAQAVVDAGKQNDALRLQVQNRQQEYERQKGRIKFLETLDAGNAVAICDYRAKVEKLQGLVDTARGQLEAAATERDELRAAIDQADKQLDQKDAQIRDLRIELDAAQQVPADSPELRQLRAELAEVTRERDQHLDSYQRIFGDLETIRETTKAAAVEAIVEWLQPVRAVDNPNMANETLQHLPQIMRHLTGLALED